MSTDEASGVPRRYEIDPDPAWDGSDDQDGVLTVVLSWVPDPLVGRPPDLAASPELAAALLADGLTGFITGPARATYDEDAFDGAGVMTPPELVRFIVGGDPAADFFYERGEALVVSERALALIFCVQEVRGGMQLGEWRVVWVPDPGGWGRCRRTCSGLGTCRGRSQGWVCWRDRIAPRRTRSNPHRHGPAPTGQAIASNGSPVVLVHRGRPVGVGVRLVMHSCVRHRVHSGHRLPQVHRPGRTLSRRRQAEVIGYAR